MNFRNVLHSLLNEISLQRWNIGIFEFETNSNIIFKFSNCKVKYLAHNFKDKWFADPFILDVTDKEIIILAEEFDRRIGRGRIAKLTIDREKVKLNSLKIILDIKSHLSFPAIYKENNNIYIYPENSQTGKLLRYKYDCKLDALVDPELVINEPLTDAIKEEFNGKSYIFSTKQPNPNSNRINVYCDTNNNKKYQLIQEIDLADNSARGAGYFIRDRDRFYRPAQDCNTTYGKGLVFQEVINENGVFRINELKRVYNRHFKYGLGIHTFNTLDNVGVVDVLGYKYLFLGRLHNRINYFWKHIAKRFL